MKMSFTVVVLFSALMCESLCAWGAEVAACDLVQATAVPTLLGQPIKQHSPNRKFQIYEGAKTSNCVFFAERAHLVMTLQEWPSPAAASKAFDAATANTDFAKYSPESSLGDKAVWFKGGAEAYGYVVLKGPRILTFDTRWADGTNGINLKGKMRPFAVDAAQRM